MAAVVPYPIGTKVQIKKFKRMPDGWNSEMFTYMMGQTVTIRSAPMPGCLIDSKSYNYKVNGNTWSWRHLDFKVLEMPEIGPNEAFRMKKHGIRRPS